ncbi:jg13407 [Pararge aegeria aegeria]|uniref:Jg13407 protein n=1 Tax=Pararge aegeria aegeria TaxID=348720 RepID=A0A8S4R0H8_9NEOP|nr:jg13407 [Pararge aegeria aegeria]
MSSMRLLIFVLLIAAMSVDAAPFFDAIYDALNGNPRRSYGYSGYGNYGYNYGYNNNGYRHVERPRQGKSWKDLCRVHYPDAAAIPGTGGIVCPY